MINFIFNVYSSVFLAVGLSASFVFFLGFCLILKQSLRRKVNIVNNKPLISAPLSAEDVSAIAGDDAVATQLDLARAYIESGKAQLAKNILEFIAEQGSSVQQQEVKRLLRTI